MAEPATDRRTRRAQREGRQSTALFISTVVLLVVAVGAGGAALVVRHDTDAVHTSIEPLTRQLREITATEDDAQRRTRELRVGARATTQALATLFAAEQAQVDASNHAVDVANQAVDQFNNAQTTDIAAAFQGAGDAAIADLETKTAAVRAATAAAQSAIAALQGAAAGG